MNQTFIVSDESKNSYGFVVLTDGINTKRFERNPIMYYMHEREKGVIGRWENIRKEGKRLLADAVFDEGTELGKMVKHQVETGFLRTASIGIENVKDKDINGVQTVVSCDLFEISIVDLPANENAVKLYADGRKPVTLLSQLRKEDKDNTNATLRTRIIDILNLDDTATDAEIIEEVKALVNAPDVVENEIEAAVKRGLVREDERGSFRVMAKADINAFRSFCESRLQKQSSKIETLLERGVKERRIMRKYFPLFRNIGEAMGTEMLSNLIDSIPKVAKLTELIVPERPEDNRNNWKLNDYRRYAPDELKKDRKLYDRLVKQELKELKEMEKRGYLS